jgi:hypothetical protein
MSQILVGNCCSCRTKVKELFKNFNFFKEILLQYLSRIFSNFSKSFVAKYRPNQLPVISFLEYPRISRILNKNHFKYFFLSLKSYFDETVLIDISSFNVNLNIEFVLLLAVAVCDELDRVVVRVTNASQRAMNKRSVGADASLHE